MHLEGELRRHSDKVESDMTPEDVTDDQLEEARKSYQALYPDRQLPTDDFFRQTVLNEHKAAVFGPEDIFYRRLKSYLTFEGIIRDQVEAREFAESIDQLPPNATVLLGPSSAVGRARETQWIYEQEIKAKVQREGSFLGIVNVDEQEFYSGESLPDNCRLVIINRSEAKKDEVNNAFIGEEGNEGYWSTPYSKELARVFADAPENYTRESLCMQVWLARANEVEKLRDDFVQAGIIRQDQRELIDPRQYKDIDSTPERIAQRHLMFLGDLAKVAHFRYPNRPVYYVGFGHNMMMDAASLRLLGEELTRENLAKLAENTGEEYAASRPLEGRKFKFEGEKLTFSFRGREKTWMLEELIELIDTLEKEAQERSEEWNISNQ